MLNQEEIKIISALQKRVHEVNLKAGWWTAPDGSSYLGNKLAVFAKIALIATEAHEALEAYRKNAMDDHLPHRSGVETEFADVFLRLLDLAGALDLDLVGAIVEKMEYNDKRQDHKMESRQAKQGKII